MSVSDITNSYKDSYNDSQPYSQPDNFLLVDDPAPSLTNEVSSLFPSKFSF